MEHRTRSSPRLARLPVDHSPYLKEPFAAMAKNLGFVPNSVAMFGFLNLWNDTMGTPLEDEPMAVGEKFLTMGGWTAGKHAR